MEHYQFIVCYYCITKRDGHNNDGHIKTKFFFLILLFFFFARVQVFRILFLPFYGSKTKQKLLCNI